MRLRTWSIAAALATLLLMVLGAYVVKTGAGLSCPDWPTCNGQLLPPFDGPRDSQGNELFTQAQILSEYFHRLMAVAASLLTVGMAVVAWRWYRDHQAVLTLSVLAVGVLFAQVLMGAATVRLGNPPWSVVAHQGLAIAFFGILVAIATLAYRLPPAAIRATHRANPSVASKPDEAPKPSKAQTVLDYLLILKPRVLTLLLVAAVTSMLVAVGRDVDPWTVVATVIGGAMASGCASAFNQVYERDLDRMMARTANRPVAAGRLPPGHVLAYSFSLGLGSFMVLGVFVNLLAALLALGGALFYICVYTVWLKRTRPSNIVIGGAAGSFPVLVGWAAATGEITLPALLLSFIIFLWTPPHFWSLALLYKDDYARAGIPMLPVVRGEDETKQQIFLYTVALLITTTSLWLFGLLSAAYLLVSMVLGALFVLLAFDLLRAHTLAPARRLFRYSILYLGFLFLYMAIDRIFIDGRVL